MNLKWIFAMAMSVFVMGNVGYAQDNMTIKYNNNILCFAEKPIIRNDKTLVQLRPIAEAMGLEIDYINESGEVLLSRDETSVVFTNNSDIIKINGREFKMISPAVNHNDYTFVPVRDLAEPFGELVSYDGETKTVTIETPIYEEEPVEEDEETEAAVDEKVADVTEETKADEGDAEVAGNSEIKRPEANPLLELKDVSSGSGKYKSCYYYQSQPDIGLEDGGRGYCWVCSYAMLISNVTGEKVTPIQVANVNIEAGYSGNFMYHTGIMDEFNCKFVPAISEESVYFDSFGNKNKGDTVIKFEDEQGVIAALKEALDLHPDGVLVRYEGYPHTMLAVEYENDTIYFNDPGMADMEHVTFEESCLYNFKLTDISFIQAIMPIEE